MNSPRSATTNDEDDEAAQQSRDSRRRLLAVALPASVVILDLIVAIYGSLIGVIPGIESPNWNDFQVHTSTLDVLFLSIVRLLLLITAYCISFSPDHGPHILSVFPEPFKVDGVTSKTQQELDEESLEETWSAWMRRSVTRPEVPIIFASALSVLWTTVKMLLRLAHEIGSEGIYDVGWWTVVAVCGLLFPLLEIYWAGGACVSLAEIRMERGNDGFVGRCFGRKNQIVSSMDSKEDLIESCLGRPLLNGEVEDTEVELKMDWPASSSKTPILKTFSLSFSTSEVDTTDIGSSPSLVASEAETSDIETSPSLAASEVGISDIGADPNYKAGWIDLLRCVAPDASYILAAFVLLLLAAIAEVLVPKLTGNILDALTMGLTGEHNNVWQVPGFKSNLTWLVITAILGGFFSGMRGSIFKLVGARVNARLRTRLVQSLFEQEIGFFDMTKTGDITSRLCTDTTLVGDQVTFNINFFLRSFVQAVGVLIFMVRISWQLSLLAFISAPTITVFSKWYGGYIRKLTNLTQERLAKANTVSEEALGNMSTVRAFGAEKAEIKRYQKSIDVYLELNRRSAIACVFFSFSYSTMPQLVTALVLLYGGMLVQSDGPDHISNGQLVTFILYLSSLTDSFNSMGWFFSSITQAVGAADKVFELMHRKPKLKSPNDDKQTGANASADVMNPRNDSITPINDNLSSLSPLTMVTGSVPVECRGQIELCGVDLFYPSQPKRKVLDGTTLRVPSGSVCALVGPSGGGKSSIISLVQHLYEPSGGTVKIDGIDVHKLATEWLYRNVSVVSQEPTLFARSIKENIIFGLEGSNEPSMSDIEEAARLANAASFIEGLPEGYDTEVGERGVQLSGGQKQRVAIARALVRKPKILLLDEATSALDAESESLVQDAIDQMLERGKGSELEGPSMTVMVVAHRFSTVRNVDTIFVVKDGQVVEEGTHDELITNVNGSYYNLVSKQMDAQDKLINSNDKKR